MGGLLVKLTSMLLQQSFERYAFLYVVYVCDDATTPLLSKMRNLFLFGKVQVTGPKDHS